MVYEAMILILASSFLDGGFTNYPSEFPSRKGISINGKNAFFSWLKQHNYNQGPTNLLQGFILKTTTIGTVDGRNPAPPGMYETL